MFKQFKFKIKIHIFLISNIFHHLEGLKNQDLVIILFPF